MTTVERTALGAGIDRVDGWQKVSGRAQYSIDATRPDLVHAALVRSTVAPGPPTQKSPPSNSKATGTASGCASAPSVASRARGCDRR